MIDKAQIIEDEDEAILMILLNDNSFIEKMLEEENQVKKVVSKPEYLTDKQISEALQLPLHAVKYAKKTALDKIRLSFAERWS